MISVAIYFSLFSSFRSSLRTRANELLRMPLCHTSDSKLALETRSRLRRPIHARLSPVSDQSSSFTDKRPAITMRSACLVWRVAVCATKPEKSHDASRAIARIENCKVTNGSCNKRRDPVVARGHFAQFPWPRLQWGVRSSLGTAGWAVGCEIAVAGKRSTTHRARLSPALLGAPSAARRNDGNSGLCVSLGSLR